MAHCYNDYDKAARQLADKASRALNARTAIADSNQTGASEAVVDALQSAEEQLLDALGYTIEGFPCWAEGEGYECTFAAEDIERGLEALCIDCGQPDHFAE
jgi:hypothetical protein